MSYPNALLFTSVQLSPDELLAFVEQNGGEAVEREKPSVSIIYAGDCALWITHASDELSVMQEDGYTPEISRRLQDEPRTCVVIERTRAEGTMLLLWSFVQAFAKQWPTVVRYERQFLSGADLFDQDVLRNFMQ